MSIDKVIEDQHAMYGKERIDYLLELGLVFSKLKNRFIEEFDEDIEEIADDLLAGTLEVAKKDVNLEYNRKVKIPEFIRNTMYGYDSLRDMLTEEYYNNSTEEIDSDVIQCWIDDNFELLCRAWLDGYEVEEEPKYLWRKKKEHNTRLDKRIYLVTGVDLKGSLGKGTTETFTKSEAKGFLKEDLDMFEAVKEVNHEL